MQTELTPTIAEMSEVVAKYMGWEYNTSLGQTRLYAIHQDWNRLHEVWEKVSSEEVDGMNNYWYQIELALCGNDKEETLWALYRAIIYVNNLKQ